MRAPNSQNIDQWLFEYFEGGLNTDQQAQLSSFLAENPEFNADFEAWQQSVVPKEEPAFTKMEQLLAANAVGGGIFTQSWFRWGLAMVVLLLIGAGATYLIDQTHYKNDLSAELIVQTDAQSLTGVNAIADGNGNISTDFNQEGSNIHSVTASIADDVEVNLAQVANSSSNNNGSVSIAFVSQTGSGGNSNGSISGSIVSQVGNQPNGNLTEPGSELPEKYGTLYRNGEPVYTIPSQDIVPQNFERTPPVATDRLSENGLGSDRGNMDLNLEGGLNDENRGGGIRELGKKIKQKLQRSLGLINLRDPYLVTPSSSALFINPSFAGSVGVPRIEMTGRSQWPSSEANTQTATFAFDSYSQELNAGIGLVYSHSDYADGLYSNDHVGLIYSYKTRINEAVSIEPSLKLSFNHRHVNWDKMPASGIIEPRVGTVYEMTNLNAIPEGSSNDIYTDLSAGLLVNTSLFYLGGTVDHIFEPTENVYSLDFTDKQSVLDRKYTLLFGCDFRKNLEGSVIFSPQVLYQNQGDYSEAWLSLGLRYRKFAFGGGVSDRGNIVGTAGLNFSQFQMNYKYDQSRSWSLNETLPSHEVTMRIFLQQRDKYAGNLLSYK